MNRKVHTKRHSSLITCYHKCASKETGCVLTLSPTALISLYRIEGDSTEPGRWYGCEADLWTCSKDLATIAIMKLQVPPCQPHCLASIAVNILFRSLSLWRVLYCRHPNILLHSHYSHISDTFVPPIFFSLSSLSLCFLSVCVGMCEGRYYKREVLWIWKTERILDPLYVWHKWDVRLG